MADYDSELRATPEQRPVIGALARLARRVDQFARKPFGYDNPPVEMISNFLGVPALYNTAENFAYGSPLTYGTGQARQLNPEVKEAALAATQFAGPLTRMVKMTKGLPVGMVIKPKGGNWLAGRPDNSLEFLKKEPVPMDKYAIREAMSPEDLGKYYAAADVEGVTDLSSQLKAAGLYEKYVQPDPINTWIDKQLNRYVKNEMGTPEDPIRALAERGITHAEVAPLNTYYGDVLGRRREAVGFPAEGLGQSEASRRWEAAADEAIHNAPASERFGNAAFEKNLLENPWLTKVPPETMTYGVYTDSRNHLSFPHLIDELRNATNPESGLPRELMLKYESLPQVSVPQAVERVHNINEWRAAQKVAADQARANNAATVVHKEYPGQGFKWVELKKPEVKTLEGLSPEQRSWYDEYLAGGVSPEKALSEASKRSNKSLEDALKYEGDTMGHCVGGYCPDVSSGKSRIFSLRNEKTGEPHVTIETQPYGSHNEDVMFAELTDKLGRHPTSDELQSAMSTAPERIIQIKGKGNKAPKEDYLPFVQDFVRSGKWSDVGDLQNTGLYKPDPRELGLYMPGAEDLVRAGYEVPDTRSQILQRAKDAGLFGDKQYVTRPEWEDVLRQQMKSEGVQGFAKGGAVEFDPARVDEIAQGLRNYEPSEGLAPHGLRHAGDSAKGKGYFGLLPHKSGMATEISSEDIEGEYPLIVPTLNREELDHLLSGAAPTDEIYNKAETYAAKRRGAGKSTFAQPDELRYPVPEKFASGGAVEYNPTHVDELVNKLREELHG